MRKFIIFLIILVLAVFAGVKIAQDPGYALFVYKQWMVELPLWLAGVILLIVFSLFYCLMHGASGLRLWFNRVRFWAQSRQVGKSYHALCLGLIDFMEGKYKNAERQLTHRAKESDTALVNYLMAAKAAHHNHEYKRRDQYLALAKKSNLSASLALEITQAQLQMDQKQFVQAQLLLKVLHKKAPKQIKVLTLLISVSVELCDWSLVSENLEKAKKLRCFSIEKYKAIEFSMHHYFLSESNAGHLKARWKAVPKELCRNEKFILIYAQKLVEHKQDDEAQVVVVNALRHEFSAALIKLYVKIEGDSKKQFKQATHWLKQYPNQAPLLAVLAQLAVREKVWGQARLYFEQSLAQAMNANVCCQFAEFLARQNELQSALHYYKLGCDALKKL